MRFAIVAVSTAALHIAGCAASPSGGDRADDPVVAAQRREAGRAACIADAIMTGSMASLLEERAKDVAAAREKLDKARADQKEFERLKAGHEANGPNSNSLGDILNWNNKARLIDEGYDAATEAVALAGKAVDIAAGRANAVLKFSEHIQLHVAELALLDSASNHAITPADSVRYARAAVAIRARTDAANAVDPTHEPGWADAYARLLADPNHTCNAG